MTETVYTQLTDDQKRDILRARVLQWEGERYGHAADVERFQALIDQGVGTDKDREGYAQGLDLCRRSIQMLDVSLGLARDAMEGLG